MPALRSLQRMIVAKIMIFVIKSYPVMMHILCHIMLSCKIVSCMTLKAVMMICCNTLLSWRCCPSMHRHDPPNIVWCHAHPIMCPPSVEYPQAVTACQEKIYNSTTSTDSHLTTGGGDHVGPCLCVGRHLCLCLLVYWTMPVCFSLCLAVLVYLFICL